MPRPRSIPGLLVLLASIHARRRPRATIVVLAALIGAGVLATRDAAPPPTATPAPGLAVTDRGFAVLTRDGDAYRVTDLDREGRERRATTLRGLGAEARVVGTRVGTGAVWRDDQRRVRVSVLDEQGRRHELDPFGQNVRTLCEGSASNDDKFVVGWLNDAGEVWVVFGPTSGAVQLQDAAERGASWCTVAIAGSSVVMLAREKGKLKTSWCSKRSCDWWQPIKGPIATRPALAIGCVRDGCVLVTRGAAGLEATMVNRSGKPLWTRALAGEHDGGAIAVVGAGDARLALARGIADGDRHSIVAETITRGGELAPLWRSPPFAGARSPALAWSRGLLAISWLEPGAEAATTNIVPLR